MTPKPYQNKEELTQNKNHEKNASIFGTFARSHPITLKLYQNMIWPFSHLSKSTGVVYKKSGWLKGFPFSMLTASFYILLTWPRMTFHIYLFYSNSSSASIWYRKLKLGFMTLFFNCDNLFLIFKCYENFGNLRIKIPVASKFLSLDSHHNFPEKHSSHHD